jgi:hypothetical protein
MEACGGCCLNGVSVMLKSRFANGFPWPANLDGEPKDARRSLVDNSLFVTRRARLYVVGLARGRLTEFALGLKERT